MWDLVLNFKLNFFKQMKKNIDIYRNKTKKKKIQMYKYFRKSKNILRLYFTQKIILLGILFSLAKSSSIFICFGITQKLIISKT